MTADPLSAYTIPTEARAERVTFDAQRMHIDLADGRTLSVPLAWVPTLRDASLEDLQRVRASIKIALEAQRLWRPRKLCRHRRGEGVKRALT
jgi:hypothetical protein